MPKSRVRILQKQQLISKALQFKNFIALNNPEFSTYMLNNIHTIWNVDTINLYSERVNGRQSIIYNSSENPRHKREKTYATVLKHIADMLYCSNQFADLWIYGIQDYGVNIITLDIKYNNNTVEIIQGFKDGCGEHDIIKITMTPLDVAN